MIEIAPIFLLDDPAQGVKSWRVVLRDLPDLQGSQKQIKWATNIRIGCLHAFIDAMMRQGGESALALRHWWTPDLQKDVRDAQRALNDELVPLLHRASHAGDWINALDWDRDVNDAGVVVRLLQEEGIRAQ